MVLCNPMLWPIHGGHPGKNKIGGIIVRTDNCAKTSGHLSFAPCTALHDA